MPSVTLFRCEFASVCGRLRIAGVPHHFPCRKRHTDCQKQKTPERLSAARSHHLLSQGLYGRTPSPDLIYITAPILHEHLTLAWRRDSGPFKLTELSQY